MLRQIKEEPAALRETMAGLISTCEKIAPELAEEKLGLLYFSSGGTSYHATLASHYLMSSLGNRPTNCIPASEFNSWVRAAPQRGSVLVIISQSGESVDALAALRIAKERGIRSVAVTNTRGACFCCCQLGYTNASGF